VTNWLSEVTNQDDHTVPSVAGASLIATPPGPQPPLEPAETAATGPSALGLPRSQGKTVVPLRVGVRVVERAIVPGAHIECRVEQLSVRRPHRGLRVRRFVLGGHPADGSPTGGRVRLRDAVAAPRSAVRP
jgi:hypothetical protein